MVAGKQIPFLHKLNRTEAAITFIPKQHLPVAKKFVLFCVFLVLFFVFFIFCLFFGLTSYAAAHVVVLSLSPLIPPTVAVVITHDDVDGVVAVLPNKLPSVLCPNHLKNDPEADVFLGFLYKPPPLVFLFPH